MEFVGCVPQSHPLLSDPFQLFHRNRGVPRGGVTAGFEASIPGLPPNRPVLSFAQATPSTGIAGAAEGQKAPSKELCEQPPLHWLGAVSAPRLALWQPALPQEAHPRSAPSSLLGASAGEGPLGAAFVALHSGLRPVGAARQLAPDPPPRQRHPQPRSCLTAPAPPTMDSVAPCRA
jgi:hypothetical protein